MSESTRDGFVTIFNPATGDPWECPEAAVDFWTGEKGWTKEPKSEKALSSMNRDELVAAAAARGIEVPADATKADILAAINAQEG